MPNNNLFPEFPPVSKADWLKQVSKDLKDRPLSDFDWIVSDDLHVSPFVQAEDLPIPPAPLWEGTKSWEICETIPVDDAVLANGQALQALEGGAEGLQFVFDTAPDWSVFEQTLDGIHLDFIGLHFAGNGCRQNPAGILGHLIRLAGIRNLETTSLRGSVEYNPVPAGGIIDWRYLADVLSFGGETLPHFKLICIDFSLNEDPIVALAETLHTAAAYLDELNARGVSAEKAAGAILFSVPVGKSYFLEIAKIRALKLLWINILKGWSLPLHYPVVAARFNPNAYSDDLYTNMIRATTMGMSAVLGGADRLTVLPYDADREDKATYPSAFGRRIARNVQHLMKMESMLDEVIDPVAGSYYIEKLTSSLAEKAWERFSQPE